MQLQYVSSAGLRVFLATAKKLTVSGGPLKLCVANEVVREILDISVFSAILEVKKNNRRGFDKFLKIN